MIYLANTEPGNLSSQSNYTVTNTEKNTKPRICKRKTWEQNHM